MLGADCGPIQRRVVLARGKWDKKNRTRGGSVAGSNLADWMPAQEPSPPQGDSQLKKNNAGGDLGLAARCMTASRSTLASDSKDWPVKRWTN
jgi:hypothetical protein